MNHVTWLMIIPIGLVIVAALLRWTQNGSARRLRLRRTALLFVPYALLALLTLFGARLGSGLWLSVINIAADFLAILLTINLAAVALFDVALRSVRLKTPEILYDVIVGATYVVALVWLMHRAGVNLASIVATSAVATAVIGLSLQSTLGSVIGGLALQVDDSLNEGDWIELENKDPDSPGDNLQLALRNLHVSARRSIVIVFSDLPLIRKEDPPVLVLVEAQGLVRFRSDGVELHADRVIVRNDEARAFTQDGRPSGPVPARR